MTNNPEISSNLIIGHKISWFQKPIKIGRTLPNFDPIKLFSPPEKHLGPSPKSVAFERPRSERQAWPAAAVNSTCRQIPRCRVCTEVLRGIRHFFRAKLNLWPNIHMDMDQYLLIPFLGGWTSIYQLFWCSPGGQGFDTLHIYIYNYIYLYLLGEIQPTNRTGGGPFFCKATGMVIHTNWTCGFNC